MTHTTRCPAPPRPTGGRSASIRNHEPGATHRLVAPGLQRPRSGGRGQPQRLPRPGLLPQLPLRALTRMTVTSRYPLEDTPPMDLFEMSDSQQAISTATAVLAWVERLDQGDG